MFEGVFDLGDAGLFVNELGELEVGERVLQLFVAAARQASDQA